MEFTIEDNILKGEVKKIHNIPNKHNLGRIFFDSFTKNAQTIAQIKSETGQKRTYHEVKDFSIRCALWLRKQNIGTGDVISICTSHDELNACIPVLATFYNGAVYNAWHHEITLDDSVHFMKLVKPKVIFACESMVDTLIEAGKSLKHSVEIVVFGEHPKVTSYNDVVNCHYDEEVKHFEPKDVENPLDMAMILFSSGTSGLPKAVSHYYNSIIDFLLIVDRPKISLWYSGLFWLSGTFSALKSLLTCSTAVFHSAFDVNGTLKVIMEYEVEFCSLKPELMARIFKDNALGKNNLKSLREISCGGSKLSALVQNYFKKHLPDTDIFENYGLTEAGSFIARSKNCITPQSIGHLLPNQQLKIVDPATGETLEANKHGEIVVKSTALMMGYFNNPEATREAIDEKGWLHTGDLGYYSDIGEVFFIDRLKELIKYRNHQIAPSEIEFLLLTHPAVLEVAVVPVPHDIDQERPMAFVKKVPGSEVTEEELVEMSLKLGNIKKLRGGVKFLDCLPRTSSGKIRRRDLKTMAKKYYRKLI